MKSDETRMLQALVTKGMCECNDPSILDKLNTLLRPMGFEAVMWPSRTHLILKDNAESLEIIRPWTEASIEELKRIIKCISFHNPVHSTILDQLKRQNWIEYDSSRNLKLSKRALVQFEDYILSIGGRYGKCQICGFIVDSDTCHDYCALLLSKMPQN
ncbi:hypothetical protein PAEPH01_0723 [Pancytospora epiphaga]|nr:hypothetical protein PAEPH01_0723 [Pancytospora epiphaga]